MNPIILIPARMASTRLPGKPLADIGGKPMIVHVMERALEADMGPVYVACGEEEIANAIDAVGGNAIITEADHQSGTDRIKEALEIIDSKGEFDTVINLQGDLPTLQPNIVHDVLAPIKKGDFDMATLVHEISDEEEEQNPNVVKAVISLNKDDNSLGKALYFSRSPVPYGNAVCYHHIGIYAFKRDALEKFTSLPQSPLEKSEKLEQLRALENDMTIGVSVVNTVPFGVDTEEDLERARALLT